jgi:pimeloyl-ACP methyl ester carboxylesterase
MHENAAHGDAMEKAAGNRAGRGLARALLIGVLAFAYCALAGCLFAGTRGQQQRIEEDYRRAQNDGGGSAVFADLTATGEIVSLDDSRFSEKDAELGLWRPLDYAAKTHPGVYFLEPFDAARIPVLFVHGMNGTPANFGYLVEHLDRSRFQAWVYSYPSGAHLDAIADHLDHTIRQLQSRQHFGSMAIVAHSMGGLVARGFILRHTRTAPADAIPLLVTISTPWEGHAAAERVPQTVNIWRDIVPGSVYLTSLFSTQLPLTTHYYLLFTFNRKPASFGPSSDRTVTVASQLSAAAQDEAVRVVGFDDTHAGVLRNPDVAALLNHLLEQTFL